VSLPVQPNSDPAREVVGESLSLNSSSFLTGQHEVPQVHGTLVTTLFLLLQVMYLCFYIISLARFHAVDETLAATVSHPVWIVVSLIVTAVVGIPIRLYLISTAAFRVPGLRQKFLRLVRDRLPVGRTLGACSIPACAADRVWIGSRLHNHSAVLSLLRSDP
jgi:hypothetical protein